MQTTATTSLNRIRIGSVSYLNARPLIYGLAERGVEGGNVELALDVPSKLINGLAHQRPTR